MSRNHIAATCALALALALAWPSAALAAAPTATVAVADNALSVGQTSLVTVTFSEAVTGFDNADLNVPNGTLSTVSTSDGGITWVATFTPNTGIRDTSNVITVDLTGVSDALSNPGTGTADSNNFAIDTQRPTATIAVADTALAAGETSLVTITFSEAVVGFNLADLIVSGNGTLSGLASADGGITWTATFTPDAGITDSSNIITLDPTGVTDAAGNTGSGTADSNNFAVDTVVPLIAAAPAALPATGAQVGVMLPLGWLLMASGFAAIAFARLPLRAASTH